MPTTIAIRSESMSRFFASGSALVRAIGAARQRVLPRALRLLHLAALLTILPVLSSCASSGANGGSRDLPPAAVGGTPWMLTELNGESVDGSALDRAPFVQFDDAGHRFAGSGGVNRISGPVIRSDDGKLTLGPLVATRMAGSPRSMEVERAFIRALERTRHLRGSRTRLELIGDDDQVLARLRP